jgi:hypothetical protein
MRVAIVAIPVSSIPKREDDIVHEFQHFDTILLEAMLSWLHMHDEDFDHSVENAHGGRDASTIHSIDRLYIVTAPGESPQLKNARVKKNLPRAHPPPGLG